MENVFDKLTDLIHEMQSQKSFEGCYIIMADKTNDEEKHGQLLCAVQGKRTQLMDMILGAIRSNDALKRMILDTLMLDAISGIIDEKEKRGKCNCEKSSCEEEKKDE